MTVLAAAGPVPLAYATGSSTGTVLKVTDPAAGTYEVEVRVLTGFMTAEGLGADGCDSERGYCPTG